MATEGRPSSLRAVLVFLAALVTAACGARTGMYTPDASASAPRDAAPDTACSVATRLNALDLLFMIDNSNSMSDNQRILASQFGVLIDQLVSPPIDPNTGAPRYPAARDIHVGVISSDLGTPGSTTPSCQSTDQGDDGLLNPIRNGLGLRAHEPWTTAPAGLRPTRCADDPTQYPAFLAFDAATTNVADFREDFVCNAFLSVGGCGLEQQLESMYRALVVHNARLIPGNTDPNAGFVRDEAILALVAVTDEEDGSTRDCRYAERGVPCRDALSVFDVTSPDWPTFDLNLRFYLYTPGTSQDPTWPIDRYIDPTRPSRGFLSLKPGHPERVVFAAIAGVPIELPMRGGRVDWDTLLGRQPDGSDGYTATSPEGPISMRQGNMDPMCSTRVVPACRREGTTARGCNNMEQYFASPSRRIAQVVRRFDEAYGNGSISSICRSDYGDALRAIVDRIQTRFCQ